MTSLQEHYDAKRHDHEQSARYETMLHSLETTMVKAGVEAVPCDDADYEAITKYTREKDGTTTTLLITRYKDGHSGEIVLSVPQVATCETVDHAGHLTASLTFVRSGIDMHCEGRLSDQTIRSPRALESAFQMISEAISVE